MDMLDVQVSRVTRAGHGSMANLGLDTVAPFHAWYGASDRRYMASIYPVCPSDPDRGLPAFTRFILLAVVRGVDGLHALAVLAVERETDRRCAMALSRDAVEWHVHLLADDRADRAAIVADLRARHVRPEPAALSA